MNKLKTFKELLKVPSAAILAMCDGLENQSKRSDFIVIMSTFGAVDSEGRCVGCAATCAAQEITHVDLNSSNIGSANERATVFSVAIHDLKLFEEAVNSLRQGYPERLLLYFGITDKPVDFFPLPHLSSTDWSWNKYLSRYRQFAEALAKLGL